MTHEQLIKLRTHLSLSQKEMGARLHRSIRHYRRYENGEVLIPFAIQELIKSKFRIK